jgi:hypothetical protein
LNACVHPLGICVAVSQTLVYAARRMVAAHLEVTGANELALGCGHAVVVRKVQPRFIDVRNHPIAVDGRNLAVQRIEQSDR